MIRNRSGVIINIGSGDGNVGFENLSAYCASRFGIMGLTESVALKVGNTSGSGNCNIRIMTISPGSVDTKMWQDFYFNYYDQNKHNKSRSSQIAERMIEMI